METSRISDHLRYMTIRILTSEDGTTNWSGSGTGFLYMFSKNDLQAPLVVTNKHVIDGVVSVGLTFHTANTNNDHPDPGPGRLISFRATDIPIVRHPDAHVDLAAIAIAPLIEHARQVEGWHPFVRCLNHANLPSSEMIADFSALEDLIMVGYPIGLVDSANNFPVIRRGITSTPYNSNYQGKREFLADIPVYGGSSGSPVFVVNEGSWSTSQGLMMGNRFALLGVLYAGHTETVNGQIVAEPIPTGLAPVAKVKHMINLGLCIKSALIEELSNELPGW